MEIFVLSFYESNVSFYIVIEEEYRSVHFRSYVYSISFDLYNQS